MGATTKTVSTTPREIMPLRESIIDAFMSGNVRNPYGVSTNMGNNPYNQSWMESRREMSPQYNVAQRVAGWGGLLGQAGQRMAERFRGSTPGATPAFLDMLNSGIFAQGPSLDSFADPEGELFTSIRGGYEDMFNQARAEALAQAKEASGNLTGSGYAANLGGVVNRSLGEQNALMSSILTQLALAQYGQENANAQNNAARFLQMLAGMAGGGVGPMEVVQSGGIGAILPPIFGGIGQGLGQRIGGK